MTAHPETRDLYFIRHAPVQKAKGHVPPSDPPILDLDYQLRKATALLPQGASLLVSPLRRAIQTADLLAPALAPASRHEVPDLAEMEFGDWAGRPVADVWDEIRTGPLHNWSFLTADTMPPAGESFTMLASRVADWMASFPFTSDPLVIIAHSGVMRAAMAHAAGIEADRAVGIPVAHFGILHLRQMDPARATAAGGQWLFAGLTDPKVVADSPD